MSKDAEVTVERCELTRVNSHGHDTRRVPTCSRLKRNKNTTTSLQAKVVVLNFFFNSAKSGVRLVISHFFTGMFP